MKVKRWSIIGDIVIGAVFFSLTLYEKRNIQESFISTLFFMVFYIAFNFLFRLIKTKMQKTNAQDNTVTIDDEFINQLLDALGGIENITEASSEVSRVKITLKSSVEIDVQKIEALNLSGIFVTGESVQINLGDKSNTVANTIHKML